MFRHDIRAKWNHYLTSDTSVMNTRWVLELKNVTTWYYRNTITISLYVSRAWTFYHVRRDMLQRDNLLSKIHDI